MYPYSIQFTYMYAIGTTTCMLNYINTWQYSTIITVMLKKKEYCVWQVLKYLTFHMYVNCMEYGYILNPFRQLINLLHISELILNYKFFIPFYIQVISLQQTKWYPVPEWIQYVSIFHTIYIHVCHWNYYMHVELY
jgi:hypothetical protein